MAQREIAQSAAAVALEVLQITPEPDLRVAMVANPEVVVEVEVEEHPLAVRVVTEQREGY